MSLRVPRSAVMPGHLLSLDDTRRIGAGSDGAGTPVLGVAVCVRTTAESVALDDALESAALRGAGDLDLLAGSEYLDGDLVAKVVGRNRFLVLFQLCVVETEAAKNRRRDFDASFLGMSDDGLVRATTTRSPLTFLRVARVALLAVAELDGVESDIVLLQNLDHRVRSCLDHGARDLLPFFIEDLGHTQLLADDS